MKREFDEGLDEATVENFDETHPVIGIWIMGEFWNSKARKESRTPMLQVHGTVLRFA